MGARAGSSRTFEGNDTFPKAKKSCQDKKRAKKKIAASSVSERWPEKIFQLNLSLRREEETGKQKFLHFFYKNHRLNVVKQSSTAVIKYQ